jgi:DNA-binding response OmpR family regulator
MASSQRLVCGNPQGLPSTLASSRAAPEILVVDDDGAMPQWSGLDVAEAARATDAQLPIVIVTGYAERTDKSRMARLGVGRLLTKPFRIDALLEAVRADATDRPGSRRPRSVTGRLELCLRRLPYRA